MYYVCEMDSNAKQVITDLIHEKMDCHFPEDLVHRCGVPSAAWREDGVIELCAYVDTYNMADRDREWMVEAEIDADGVVNLTSVSLLEAVS